MESQNHTRNLRSDSKTAPKVNAAYKRGHNNQHTPGKKILEQKKSGAKLNKLFEMLAYQELDAD